MTRTFGNTGIFLSNQSCIDTIAGQYFIVNDFAIPRSITGYTEVVSHPLNDTTFSYQFAIYDPIKKFLIRTLEGKIVLKAGTAQVGFLTQNISGFTQLRKGASYGLFCFATSNQNLSTFAIRYGAFVSPVALLLARSYLLGWPPDLTGSSTAYETFSIYCNYDADTRPGFECVSWTP